MQNFTMITTARSNDTIERRSETDSNFSYISIVIPVFNDPDGIKDTLDSLVNQEYPIDNFEIIIADNGSIDNTCKVIEEYIKKYPQLIRVVVEDTIKSSYAARNKGIGVSQGSVIAFIDADMSVDNDWLTRINQSLQKDKWDYLGCGMEIYLKNKTIYELYDKITGFPIRSYIYDSHFAPTCCLVVRRIVFETLGLFDPRFISSGDYEFGNRVYLSGKNLNYNPDIVMRHPARSSFKELYEKSFRVGRGILQLSIYYPERYPRWYRTLLNPVHYLPEIPWKFIKTKKRKKIWKDLSFRDKITLYFFNWSLKFAKILGYLYEGFRSR
jgi:glycosyltransferase AglI